MMKVVIVGSGFAGKGHEIIKRALLERSITADFDIVESSEILEDAVGVNLEVIGNALSKQVITEEFSTVEYIKLLENTKVTDNRPTLENLIGDIDNESNYMKLEDKKKKPWKKTHFFD